MLNWLSNGTKQTSFINFFHFFWKHFLKKGNILKPFTNITFRASNSFSNYLLSNKDQIDVVERSGVYELTCNSCNAKYIGRTLRNFKARLKEHLRCLNPLSTEFSYFAKHLLESNHSFDQTTNFKNFILANKGNILNNLDYLEIQKSFKNTDFLLKTPNLT